MENHMSFTSCINHPEKEPVLVLHGWQLDFCNTNQVAAGLMSLFEYWHNVKVKMQAKKLKNQRDELDLIQHHTQDDLIDKLLYLTKTPACIRRAIEFLEQKKIITVCRNPNKRYKFDRTRHFIFHPEVVNNWLKNRNKKINAQQENNAYVEPKMDKIQAADYPSSALPTAKTAEKFPAPAPSSKEKAPNSEKNPSKIIFDFALKDFSLTEQANTCKILNRLEDMSLQQSILDEYNQALSGGNVKNALAYLAALVERANQGKFLSTAKLAQQRVQQMPLASSTPQTKKPHELFPVYPDWQAKQEEIKILLKLSDYMSFVLPIRAYGDDKTVFLRCPNTYSHTFINKIKKRISTLFNKEIIIYTA